MLLLAPPSFSALIQSSNRIDWLPGVTVGTRIPPLTRTHLIDMTPYCDPTGVSNCSYIINYFIGRANPNDVLFLSNGWYRCDSPIALNKDDVTLRGQGSNTVLFATNNTYLFTMGGLSAIPQPQIAIVGGYEKGSTNLTLNNISGLSSGDLVRISMGNPPTNEVLTISPHGYERVITQTAVIDAIVGTNIHISPPLVWNFNHNQIIQDISPRAYSQQFRARKRIGLENLKFTLKDPTTVAGTSTTSTPDFLYWSMTNGSGSAVTANVGTNGTTDASWVTGYDGSGFALDFNGTSQSAATAQALNYGTNAVTLSLRVYPRDTNNFQFIFESSSAGAANTYAAYIASGLIYFYMLDGSGARQESFNCPPVNQWSKLDFIFDSRTSAGDVRVFLNGAEVTTTLVTSSRQNPNNFATEVLYIGARNRTQNFFNGKLDDVRIYKGSKATSDVFGTGAFLAEIQTCYDSWITNCVFEWSYNFSVSMDECAHVLFHGNRIQYSQGAGPNHSGFITGNSSGCLIENNIIANIGQIAFMFNGGFAGNALFANYFANNGAQDIDMHQTHPLMNLFEANRMVYFELDGFFGSSSHQTLFRNGIEGSYGVLSLKRWSTYIQVIGNVLGVTGGGYAGYTSETSGVGNVIVQTGYPNIGNNDFVGICPPQSWNFPGTNMIGSSLVNGYTFTNNQNSSNLVGNFSFVPAPLGGVYALKFQDNVDTNRYYPNDGNILQAFSAGTSSNLVLNRSFSVSNGWTLFVAGQNSYQQLHSDDKFTDNFKWNYDYADHEIKTNSTDTLPLSLLYPNGAPAWWGTNRWPAVSPELIPRIAPNPAQSRLLAVEVPNDDQIPPSVPTAVAASTDGSQVNLTWLPATDNIEVVAYSVERTLDVLGLSGFTQIATFANTSFTDTGLLAGLYNYRVRAMDAAGNLSDYSDTVGATLTEPPVDESAPTAPASPSASATSTDRITLSWEPSTDNVGVTGYLVERAQGAGATSFIQVSSPADISFNDTVLASGTVYNYQVRAVDAAGNVSPYSSIATATTASPPYRNDLIAAYSFNEGSGATAFDASGKNMGTINGATRVTPGKDGGALSLDGIDNTVVVPHSYSLNISLTLTLEAWIYPTTVLSDWRSVIQKGANAYFLGVTNLNGSLHPVGGGTFDGGEERVTGANGIALNAWTHVATTYDGAMLRVYVNGTEAGSRAVAGLIERNSDSLLIGGSIYPDQYFQGMIDEVRIYRGALTQSEIQVDMTAPILLPVPSHTKEISRSTD